MMPEVAAQDLETALAQIHHVNQMEIELGQMAQRQSQTKAVRDFGAKMVRDHQAADKQVMDFARQQGIEVGEFEGTNEVQRNLLSTFQETRDMLSSLQGRSFDQQYLASQVAMHDYALNAVMGARQQLPALVPLAGKLIPVLQDHRDHAYRILGQPQMRQARASPPAGR